MLATQRHDAQGTDVDLAPIKVLLDRIIAELEPVQIRLFGSRARGSAHPMSDWDLFVVVPDDQPAAAEPFIGYRLRRETRLRADVILCPVSEYAEDRDTPNTLAYEAAHFGVSLYER